MGRGGRGILEGHSFDPVPLARTRSAPLLTLLDPSDGLTVDDWADPQALLPHSDAKLILICSAPFSASPT